MINLPKDFKEILQLLNENSVRYVLVGGYAVAYHGYPRFTGDIDILLLIEDSNAQSTIKALEQFGFGSLGLNKEDFLKENQVIQLGVHPLRIDLITSISGISNQQVFSNAIDISIDGITIPIISKEDLIQNKKASARPKDIADIAYLDK